MLTYSVNMEHVEIANIKNENSNELKFSRSIQICLQRTIESLNRNLPKGKFKTNVPSVTSLNLLITGLKALSSKMIRGSHVLDFQVNLTIQFLLSCCLHLGAWHSESFELSSTKNFEPCLVDLKYPLNHLLWLLELAEFKSLTR